jgi:site-specific recombinase
VVRAAAVVMSDIVPIAVDESMLHYTVATRTLSITAPSLVKQRLLIQAPEILTRLERELGAQSCPRALV